ncbi:MAG: hypothetical protein ACR2P2_12630 [Nakamurella sp.]
MDPVEVDVDESVEFWNSLEDRSLIAGKRAATALGLALFLKFYGRHGQFPRGASDLPGAAIVFVTRQ